MPGRFPQKYRARWAAETSMASIITGLHWKRRRDTHRDWGSVGVASGLRWPQLTSRNLEMSRLSLTPMATTFSNIQKNGRSSPSLGLASLSRR